MTAPYGPATTLPLLPSGVSRRTLQRQAARLLELGPAGLVDARRLHHDRDLALMMIPILGHDDVPSDYNRTCIR